MEIDNFSIFRKHLDFVDKTDRYIIHILRRPKDCKEISNTWGSNECQRLLRTYYIDSLDYFDRKIDAIKELCTTNRARAYIIPQVRNNFECLLNLGEKILETIRNGNYSVKPEHLLRSAYCEYHRSRKKTWIIDLDSDNMKEYIEPVVFGGKVIDVIDWDVDGVLNIVKEELLSIGKKEDDAFVVPTKSGYHIVTSPFNLQSASKKCNMLFEGEKNVAVSVDKYILNRGDKGYTGSIGLDTKYKTNYEKKNGWLHKDGMSLLYLNID